MFTFYRELKVAIITAFSLMIGLAAALALAQVPPPPPPGGLGGTACHLLGSNSQVPAGFAAPYSFFDTARSLLIQVFCSSSGATVTAGTGASNQIVYNTGYKWMASQNQWAPITFTGTAYSGSTAWLAGTGNAPISSSQIESGTNYVVGYTCQNVNSQWKCGCSDQACTTNKWQLQSFNSTGGTAGGGGDTSGTTLTNLRNVFAYRFQVLPSGSGYVVVPMPASRVMKIFPMPTDSRKYDSPGRAAYIANGETVELWWAGTNEDEICWRGQTPALPRWPGWGVGAVGFIPDDHPDMTTPSGTQRLTAPSYFQAGITKFYIQCGPKGHRTKEGWNIKYENQKSNFVDANVNNGPSTGDLPGAAPSSGSGYGVGGSLTVKINGVPITKPDGTSSVIPGGPLNIEWSASSQYKACEGFAAGYFQQNDLLPTSGSAVLRFTTYQKSDVPTFMLTCAGPGN